MTSFISALSLFVLVLVSGCFTLPITENPLWETSSPFHNDVTTDKPFGERMAFDDATISSTSFGIQRSSDELSGLETSSVFEDASRQPRVLVDEATEVSSTFVPTTEGSFRQQREMNDSSEVTVESTTERAEFIPRDLELDSQNETEVATESSHNKREFDDSVFTTSNFVTGMRSSEQLLTTIEPETSSQELQMDFTTDVMSSFPSTSSAVAPELYTREPSTTRKYTGLLADQEEEEKEHDHEEHKKPHGKHQKGGLETEEHEQSHEKHEKVHGKHKKPLLKHESEEHEHDDEVKKDIKHKNLHSKHGKDELEVEKPKKESKEESSEEKKVSGKHSKAGTKKEAHKKESEEISEEKKVSGKHSKAGTKKEEHKKESEESSEEKKVSRKHGKVGTEKKAHKQEGEKESNEEKKVSRKHGKEETEKEEHKQEGDKEVEEGRQPEKHDEDNFEKDVEVAEPKVLIKKLPIIFRKVEIESDDGIKYPKAVYDQDAWKNVPQLPSDFAVLDETSDVVTTFSKLNSLDTVESHTEESKLNQGEEPSRAE